MASTTRIRCQACGYDNSASASACGMCGELTGVRRSPQETVETDRFAPEPGPIHFEPAPPSRSRVLGLPEPWLFALAGAVLAPIFALTPLLRYVGWFFRSLCHEIGHSTLACVFGMPAFPAIRIDGHAASIHRDQIVPLALAFWAVIAAVGWGCRKRPRARIALAVATLLYPALAFTEAKELLHLLGGHLGELTIGAVFLWQALSGAFTHNATDRLLYAIVGWHLVFANVWLTGGLVFSRVARAEYENNGSFGLTNDYIRVANEMLSWSLPSVALCMLVPAVATPLVSWLAWRATGER